MLGEVKERPIAGDETGLETKGRGSCWLLDELRGVTVSGTSDSGPSFPGSHIGESQCFYAQRSKKFQS